MPNRRVKSKEQEKGRKEKPPAAAPSVLNAWRGGTGRPIHLVGLNRPTCGPASRTRQWVRSSGERALSSAETTCAVQFHPRRPPGPHPAYKSASGACTTRADRSRAWQVAHLEEGGVPVQYSLGPRAARPPLASLKRSSCCAYGAPRSSLAPTPEWNPALALTALTRSTSLE